MNLLSKLTLSVVTIFALAGAAQATTLATFADPSVGTHQPLFTLHYQVDPDTDELLVDQISGTWPGSATPTGDGLVLYVPFDNSVYRHVSFTMAPVAVNPTTGRMSAGSIQFYDEYLAPLINVAWTTGRASVYSFGAADTPTRQGLVTIAYKSYTFADEAFGIGFANPNDIGSDAMAVTGTFTSSGTPEPASLILLILGSVVTVIRRR